MNGLHRYIGFVMICALVFLSGCSVDGQSLPELTMQPGPGVALAAEKSPVPGQKQNDDRVALADGFSYQKLDDALKVRITGNSYPEDDSEIGIQYADLRYIRILYYDFDGKVRQGEIIMHKSLAEEVMEIFHELYKAKYPLASVKLIDDFNADDEASMKANNTSGFNYRVVKGTKKRSLHSYGMALDVNPLLNPYVKGSNVDPDTAETYADRSRDFEGKIDKNDLCYKLFHERGWKWGGDWKTVKDYQHFEKEVAH